MAKYPLKAWDNKNWQRKLSKTLTVSRVDEDIPTEKQRRNRKPWQIALTQTPEANVGDVEGLPKGNTLLLSEYDVLALVRYLLEPQVAMWVENPEPSEEGDYEALMFLQPGMVDISDSGKPVNGEAQWSPEYFKRQEPLDPSKGLPTLKLHTLPWKLQR